MRIGPPFVQAYEEPPDCPEYAYVILSSELGVFLGTVPAPDYNGRPLGLWSQAAHVSPYMPSAAVAFETVEELLRFADRFEPPPSGLTWLRAKCMQNALGHLFVDKQELVALGCKTWLEHHDMTANTLPL